MPRLETLQLFNLSQFIESVFTPAVRLFTETRVVHQQDMYYDFALSNLLETIWWLHVGVDLEYFPERHANELMSSSVFIVENIADFVQRRASHFWSPWIDVAQSVVRQRRLSEIGDSFFFHSPETLRGSFQNLLMLSTILGAEPLTQKVMTALNFATEKEWLNLMAESAPADEVSRTLSGISQYHTLSTDVSAVGLFSGFFKAVRFMSALEQAFDELSRNEEIDQDDFYLFRRRIGTLQRWRFSVHIPIRKDRFEEIASAVLRITVPQIRSDITKQSEDEYLSRIRGLILNWNIRGGAGDLSSTA